MKIKKLAVLVATTLATTSQMVYATDVFRMEGYGPVSRAMGGTATAYDVGAAGMMANPATLCGIGGGSPSPFPFLQAYEQAHEIYKAGSEI